MAAPGTTFLAAAFAALSAPALAACGGEAVTVLSCSTGGGAKTLDVCIRDGFVTYAFGPRGGTPQLDLSVPVAEIEHQPWNGIGRSIWETTTFRNAGHAYEVHISVDRLTEGQPTTGGVAVMKGGAELARVACDPGTAIIGLWAVSDAKQAVGQCWDQGRFAWRSCS